METQMKISKELMIGEVMARWPHVTTIMARHGFKLGGCNTSPFETIEQTASKQGMAIEKIEVMVADVNEELSKEKPAESLGGIITVTELAAKHIKNIMTSDGKENSYLKLGV